MSYYNYHAIAKNLLNSGHCFSVSIFANYHNIKPALVLYFDNHKPIPIREYMWKNYLPIINNLKLKINNENDIKIS